METSSINPGFAEAQYRVGKAFEEITRKADLNHGELIVLAQNLLVLTVQAVGDQLNHVQAEMLYDQIVRQIRYAFETFTGQTFIKFICPDCKTESRYVKEVCQNAVTAQPISVKRDGSFGRCGEITIIDRDFSGYRCVCCGRLLPVDGEGSENLAEWLLEQEYNHG
jgi:hypothetical protein